MSAHLGVAGLGRAGSLSTLQSNADSARGQPVRPPEVPKSYLTAAWSLSLAWFLQLLATPHITGGNPVRVRLSPRTSAVTTLRFNHFLTRLRDTDGRLPDLGDLQGLVACLLLAGGFRPRKHRLGLFVGLASHPRDGNAPTERLRWGRSPHWPATSGNPATPC